MIAWQIAVIGSIWFASYFWGWFGLLIATIGWGFWTSSMVFMPWLAGVQAISVLIGCSIGLVTLFFRNRGDEKPKKIYDENTGREIKPITEIITESIKESGFYRGASELLNILTSEPSQEWQNETERLTQKYTSIYKQKLNLASRLRRLYVYILVPIIAVALISLFVFSLLMIALLFIWMIGLPLLFFGLNIYRATWHYCSLGLDFVETYIAPYGNLTAGTLLLGGLIVMWFYSIEKKRFYSHIPSEYHRRIDFKF